MNVLENTQDNRNKQHKWESWEIEKNVVRKLT